MEWRDDTRRWRRLAIRGGQAAAGVLLITTVFDRVIFLLNGLGWKLALAPMVALAGLLLVLEAVFEEDGDSKAASATTRDTALEQALLRAAADTPALSVETAALATGLRLVEAQSALRRLERDGFMVSSVDDAGCQWFRFPGLGSGGREGRGTMEACGACQRVSGAGGAEATGLRDIRT